MTDFAPLVGQPLPVRLLTRLIATGRLPNALLFTGSPGIGKRTAARLFAMACNCAPPADPPADPPVDPPADPPADSDRPCGHCPACRKIAGGHHPDVFTLEPAGNPIKIDQIRELVTQLAMKPFEARVRVVVIPAAQQLTRQAGNALLKALEEPPVRTVFVLIAPERTDLLPTVVSRCQHVRFHPLDPVRLAELLVARDAVDPAAARRAARTADGSLARARQCADPAWRQRRDALVEHLEALAQGGPRAALALAEHLARERSDLDDALDMLQTWLRDVIMTRVAPERVMQSDLLARLIRAAERPTPLSTLLDRTAAVERARRDLAANLNPRLTLEVMTLALCRERHRSGAFDETPDLV